jgi:hypothetical protein
MNRKSRVMRMIFLAILFCTIAERAIAQIKSDVGPPLEGAIVWPLGPPLNSTQQGPGMWVRQCAGVIANLISNGPSIEGSDGFCPPVVPPRQTLMAGLMVLGLYLQRHPEQSHLDSHLECKLVALRALQEAWPCPK